MEIRMGVNENLKKYKNNFKIIKIKREILCNFN